MSSKGGGGGVALGVFAGIAALAALAASAYVYKDEIAEATGELAELVQSENTKLLNRTSVALDNLERQICELESAAAAATSSSSSTSKTSGGKLFKQAVIAVRIDIDYLTEVLDTQVKKEEATEAKRKALVNRLNLLDERMDREDWKRLLASSNSSSSVDLKEQEAVAVAAAVVVAGGGGGGGGGEGPI